MGLLSGYRGLDFTVGWTWLDFGLGPADWILSLLRYGLPYVVGGGFDVNSLVTCC